MILRRLTPADVVAYRDLRLRALAEEPAAFMSSVEEEGAESLDWFAARLAPDNATVMLGAFDDDALVGMVGFGRNERRKTRHTGFIRSMYVLAAWRGRGTGAALLSQAIDNLKRLDGVRQVFLEVLHGNLPAVALYTRLGFAQYGVQPEAMCVDGVYHDDILMHLSLSPAAR